jgi:hypothetical protein
MNRQRGLLLCEAFAVALLGSSSLAASSQATELRLAFSSRKPATRAAMTIHIRYTKPGDPSAKPPPIRRFQLDAPIGTGFGISTVPACKASDAELMLAGPRACPTGSTIGGGTIRVVTGFGPPFDPFDSPTPVFNDGNGWLEVSQDPSRTVTIAVTRLAVSGSRVSGKIGAAPGGPPDGETAVSTVDLSFPVSTGYVTTPPTCPRSARWTTAGTFGFGDGTTQVVRADTPCSRIRRQTTPRQRVRQVCRSRSGRPGRRSGGGGGGGCNTRRS